MGDKIKNCRSGKTENSENQSFKLHCSCNPYDFNFPPDHPPPPAPPNGRDDLWDLQFCRWWGWNWVRKREAEATLVARYEDPRRGSKQETKEFRQKDNYGIKTNSHESHISKCCAHPAPIDLKQNGKTYSQPPPPQNGASHHPRSTTHRQVTEQSKGANNGSAQPNYDTQSIKSQSPSCGPNTKPQKDEICYSALPTKKQFKEMCKCLLGRRQKQLGCCQMAAMANLYKTPSGSTCTMERLAYGIADTSVLAWPKCTSQKKHKPRKERTCGEKCQVSSSQSKVPDHVPEHRVLQATTSEEAAEPKSSPTVSQKFYSTEESIEYMAVHLQHVQSDVGSACKEHGCNKHGACNYKQKYEEEKIDHQTQTHTPRDHKETQTHSGEERRQRGSRASKEENKPRVSSDTKEERKLRGSYDTKGERILRECCNAKEERKPRTSSDSQEEKKGERKARVSCETKERRVSCEDKKRDTKEERKQRGSCDTKEERKQRGSCDTTEERKQRGSCDTKEERQQRRSCDTKEERNQRGSSDTREERKCRGSCYTTEERKPRASSDTEEEKIDEKQEERKQRGSSDTREERKSRGSCDTKEERKQRGSSDTREERTSRRSCDTKEERKSRASSDTEEEKKRRVSCDDKKNGASSSSSREVTKTQVSKEVTTQGPCATRGTCQTECATYSEQIYKINSSKHKTICIRVCCCGNCKPVISTDASDCFDSPNDLGKSTSSKGSRKGDDNTSKNCAALNNAFGSNKDYQMTYPIIMPPSTTKMLSKFGTPSKNYPWMQDIASDATTTTLNNWEIYKSPASGKTYEFNTVLEYDSRESFTLPELIDITEDLSYLKKIENSTSKSENESRLLLDAVCDAILHDHDEKSLDFLDDLQPGNWKEALNRDYKNLETLCDLTREFRSKSEVHTEVSRSYFNTYDDAGMNTAGIRNDPDDMKRMMKSILESMMYDDSNADGRKSGVSKGCSSEPFYLNIESRKTDYSYEFKGDDDDVFTKTGLLASRRSDVNKKSIKREAPNSAKSENNCKKVKHDEENKVKMKNQENVKIMQNAGAPSDRVGGIFSRIEDIVKQSKIKRADMQRILNCTPQKPGTSAEFSECVLETHCLGASCSTNDAKNKATEKDSNSSRRIYKMSSDAFIGAISPFVPKPSEHANMKCYDIFSDQLNKELYEKKSCTGLASQTIFEEENAKSSEDINKNDDKNENTEKIIEKMASKLSVHSFVVCDEKSTIDEKPGASGIGVKREMVFKRKKNESMASLIPIRKQSSDGNVAKP